MITAKDICVQTGVQAFLGDNNVTIIVASE